MRSPAGGSRRSTAGTARGESRCGGLLLRAVTLAYRGCVQPEGRPGQPSGPGAVRGAAGGRRPCGGGRHLVSGERVRRLLLHLLALRRTTTAWVVGVPARPGRPRRPAAVAGRRDAGPVLSGPSGPRTRPGPGAPGRPDRMVWHAADLLEDLVVDGRVSGDQQRSIARGLAPVVASIVAACDRATPRAGGPGR